MPIVIKSRREIELMRQAGAVAHDIIDKIKQAAVPGVTTAELDDLAARELAIAGGRGMSRHYPTYKDGEGFPGHSCLSINEVVVHGIPGPRRLRAGDIITIDLATMVDGWICDTATTVAVGPVSPRVQRLLDVTRGALDLAVQHIKPDKKWTDIARLMQYHVERHGFSVIREFVGHGVGRTMHEDPKVPNFVTQEHLRGDFRLRPGMTLAIEPMVAMGHRDVHLLDDNWTVVTADGSPAAHFEHTVAVTANGADVLSDGRVPVAAAV